VDNHEVVNELANDNARRGLAGQGPHHGVRGHHQNQLSERAFNEIIGAHEEKCHIFVEGSDK